MLVSEPGTSTKYAIAINLKTAKALGLTLQQSSLAIADEAIDQI
jgi:3-deoxy-D-arabino-heptulosonate 7-phosphate (DAHP) synthase